MEIIGKITNYSTSSLYVGKKVFSQTGRYLGKVKDVIIKNNSIIGIKIGNKLIIEISYIYSNEEQIMLNINPVILNIGKIVYDVKGRILGKVVKLERKSTTNNYENLIIKKKIWNKAIKVNSKDVATTQENIILKIEFKEDLKKDKL